MTEEGIRQKAELKLDELDDWGFDFDEWSIADTYINGAVFGAEIATKEFEKQIEKMKCGQNCRHSYLFQEDRKCEFTYCDCTNCKDKWELQSVGQRYDYEGRSLCE